MSTQMIGGTVYSGTIGADGITFTGFGIGIGTNGAVYTTGNANSPLSGVYVIGYGYAIGIEGQTIQQAALTYAPFTPMNVGAVYILPDGQTIIDQITLITPVPEPNSAKIFLEGGGLGGLAFMIFKRRKISKPQ